MEEIKKEVRASSKNHARKLMKKLEQIMDLPDPAKDSIYKELEYASLDGYRITMRILNEDEEIYNR